MRRKFDMQGHLGRDALISERVGIFFSIYFLFDYSFKIQILIRAYGVNWCQVMNYIHRIQTYYWPGVQKFDRPAGKMAARRILARQSGYKYCF